MFLLYITCPNTPWLQRWFGNPRDGLQEAYGVWMLRKYLPSTIGIGAAGEMLVGYHIPHGF